MDAHQKLLKARAALQSRFSKAMNAFNKHEKIDVSQMKQLILDLQSAGMDNNAGKLRVKLKNYTEK